MNAKSLQHLSQKADGVEVVLFTENEKGGKGFLTKSLVTDFQNEHSSLQIKPNPDCHDRLIELDYGEETQIITMIIKDIRKWRLRRTSTNFNQLVDFGV